MTINREEFLKYYNMGYSDNRISTMLKCSSSSVNNYRNKLRLAPNFVGRGGGGKSAGRPQVYDHSEIKQKILAGWKNREIVAHIGCSWRVVYEARKKMEKRRNVGRL